MSNDDWTPLIGLRNASISLIWRSALAAVFWIGALWVFHVALGGIGVTRVPILITLLFGAIVGTGAGFIVSRGLDERAGFVSPLLTGLALAFAALAIIGGEAVFARMAPNAAASDLRVVIVAATMVFAAVWITKHTLLEN